MLRNETFESQYSETLDALRMLAQQDLLDWWEGLEGSEFIDRRSMIEDPFAEIVRVYGSAASSAAADYVFLQRSLDEELSGEVYPRISEPAAYEQAVIAARWATTVPDAKMLSSTDPMVQARIHRDSLAKLQGVANRLVAFPGRDTIYQATVDSGTRYARIPEPNACAFCLVLASRGAVYTKDTVTRRGGGIHAYHDNCRCLGIEVKNFDELPQINKDLAADYEKGELDLNSKTSPLVEAE